MRFSVKQYVLDSIIHKAKSLAFGNNIDAILSNYLMEIEGKKLRMASTNMDLSLLAETSSIDVVREGRALIPAAKLAEIVKSLDKESLIDLEVSNNVATVRCETASWEVNLRPDIENFPSLKDVSKIEGVPVESASFVKSMKKAMKAALIDSKQTSAQLIRIGGGLMEATDGVRYQSVDFPFDGEILLTVGEADILVEILSQSTDSNFVMAVMDQSIVVKIGGDSFIGQAPVAKFMDTNPYRKMKEREMTVLSVSKKDLVNGIKKARILADPRTKLLILRLSDDSLSLLCEDRYHNLATVGLAASWKGGSREIGANADYLFDMIDSFESVDIQINLGQDRKGQLAPIIVTEQNHFAILAQALISSGGEEEEPKEKKKKEK